MRARLKYYPTRIAHLERETSRSGPQTVKYAQKLIRLRSQMQMMAAAGKRAALRGMLRLGSAETIVHLAAKPNAADPAWRRLACKGPSHGCQRAWHCGDTGRDRQNRAGLRTAAIAQHRSEHGQLALTASSLASPGTLAVEPMANLARPIARTRVSGH